MLPALDFSLCDRRKAPSGINEIADQDLMLDRQSRSRKACRAAGLELPTFHKQKGENGSRLVGSLLRAQSLSEISSFQDFLLVVFLHIVMSSVRKFPRVISDISFATVTLDSLHKMLASQLRLNTVPSYASHCVAGKMQQIPQAYSCVCLPLTAT